jgi:hypothetical protein
VIKKTTHLTDGSFLMLFYLFLSSQLASLPLCCSPSVEHWGIDGVLMRTRTQDKIYPGIKPKILSAGIKRKAFLRAKFLRAKGSVLEVR